MLNQEELQYVPNLLRQLWGVLRTINNFEIKDSNPILKDRKSEYKGALQQVLTEIT
jgi:hypothetical protein